ncbi:hypothetical protein [Halomonas sp. CSM-2]|uniref:hypothetical protein n=1 Tax=Halomonas sp. CSM-2 TaxID=1975722 RepID=UPI001594E50A|nr:hypothetical protein [Halomonas sp. CSM-2]
MKKQIKNIRICVDEVNENYYIVIVAFDETPQTTTDLAIITTFLSWFLPLIASHGLLPLLWSGFLFSNNHFLDPCQQRPALFRQIIGALPMLTLKPRQEQPPCASPCLAPSLMTKPF